MPIVTVVATPEPEGPPIRNEDSTTARPAALRRPPMAANEKSMKKRPAPDCCSTAPNTVNRMIRLDATSTVVPKMPSSVM